MQLMNNVRISLAMAMCTAIIVPTAAIAETADAASEQTETSRERAPLMVGTTTIQANEEEPMTTIIMPWRDSAPVEIDDKPIQLVTEELLPIDPEVFRRQFQYYNAPP